MTGLVLADAAVIAGGFLSSLPQALTSPWMLAVPGALAVLALRWLTGRRSRRMPFPAERAHGDTQPIEPAVDDSVRMLARWLDDDVIAGLEREWNRQEGGRG